MTISILKKNCFGIYYKIFYSEENSSNKKNSEHLKELIETFALKEEQLSKQIEVRSF